MFPENICTQNPPDPGNITDLFIETPKTGEMLKEPPPHVHEAHDSFSIVWVGETRESRIVGKRASATMSLKKGPPCENRCAAIFL